MVELTVHPAGRRPGLALALCFGLGLVGSAAWQFLPQPWVVVPLLAYLAYSLAPFFAPTRYRLGERLLVTRLGLTTAYPWERFRAFAVDQNGVFLTPYRRKGGTFRGLLLLQAGNEDVLSFLREKGLHERAG